MLKTLYLIYSLMASLRHLIKIDLQSEFVDLSQNGVVTVDLQKKIAEPWSEHCSLSLNKFVAQFPAMLASKTELFSKLKIVLEAPLGEQWKVRKYESEMYSANGNLLVTINKPENFSEVELAAPKSETSGRIAGMGSFIEDLLLVLMLKDVIPNVFIASSERTGAVVFEKQLNLATGKILDSVNQLAKTGINLTPIFRTIHGQKGYASPIKHNLDFISQLPSSNSEYGELFKSAPELLQRFEAIVGGTYVTLPEGVTYFQPKGTVLKLNSGAASSSVRSLLIVWYWLKFFAKKGDMLMLDEPELNLHPANQRRLARFIATLVNHGVKVFLTTHSDYHYQRTQHPYHAGTTDTPHSSRTANAWLCR